MATLIEINEFLDLLEKSMTCHTIDRRGEAISQNIPLDLSQNHEKRISKNQERK